MKHRSKLAALSLLSLQACAYAPYGRAGNGMGGTNRMAVAMPACRDQTDNRARGWIKLFVPEKLDFRSRFRRVTFGTNLSQGSPDERFDTAGHADDPRPGHGHDGAGDPFHIYLGPTRDVGVDPFPNDPAKPYILVSVIIPASRQRDFYFARLLRPDVNAVGLYHGDPHWGAAPARTSNRASPALLCGRFDRQPSLAGAQPDPGVRQAASFYIDSRRLRRDAANPLEASYTILLQPYSASETPIVVDPKVYNDG